MADVPETPGSAGESDGSAVDVGIPTYGAPRYLAEAIESVLAQTHVDFRLVISEDGPGSNDVTAVVAPYLADPRVAYRTTGSRVGAAANLTSLLQSGDAPYVAILHDDDRWEPGFLAARLTFLSRHDECGLVFSANTEIDDRGATTGRSNFELPEGSYPPADFVPILLRRNVICAPTVVVRRSAYDAVGPTFDERFPVMYDYDMWMRIALRFSVGFLVRCDASYRRHDKQTTFRVPHMGKEWLRLLDHFERLVAVQAPGLQIQDRRRSGAYLSAALDEIEHRRRRDAWRLLRSGIRLYPPSLLDPRFWAAIVSLALGPFGPPPLARTRRLVHRRGIRPHVRAW